MATPTQRAAALRNAEASRYRVDQPGDLVQVDTADIRPPPGVVYKHFTGRDVVCRWDVLDVYHRATARSAASFLDGLLERTPFPVRAIQVDGGSEFKADFEHACQERGILLFVLPPRSPKLNGCVERAQRTHTEEFYEVWDLTWTVAELNRDLQDWERVYNRCGRIRRWATGRLSNFFGSSLPQGKGRCHQCTGRVHTP